MSARPPARLRRRIRTFGEFRDRVSASGNASLRKVLSRSATARLPQHCQRNVTVTLHCIKGFPSPVLPIQRILRLCWQPISNSALPHVLRIQDFRIRIPAARKMGACCPAQIMTTLPILPFCAVGDHRKGARGAGLPRAQVRPESARDEQVCRSGRALLPTLRGRDCCTVALSARPLAPVCNVSSCPGADAGRWRRRQADAWARMGQSEILLCEHKTPDFKPYAGRWGCSTPECSNKHRFQYFTQELPVSCPEGILHRARR